jgi:hypothetical protein
MNRRSREILGDIVADVQRALQTEEGKQAFGVVHGIGKGILSTFGAAPAADRFESMERDAGFLPTEQSPFAAAAEQLASAAARKAGHKPQPLLHPLKVKPEAKQSLWQRWRWPIAIGGGALGLAGIVALIVRARR